MTRSTFIHLRFPFSYFLMPVFMLALATSQHPVVWKAVLSFVIIHLLLFTASNGFNSYYDRDTESIGGIEKPPPVTPDLLWVTLVFDILAIALGFIISPVFAGALSVYGTGSKLYSWERVRVKCRPIISWISVGIFQGLLVFLMSYGSFDINGYSDIFQMRVMIPAVLSSLVMLAAYPMTQIYQHDEDRKRGDRTLSFILGIRGTFVFTAVLFIIVAILFIAYYLINYGLVAAIAFIIPQLFVIAFFFLWMYRAWNNSRVVGYKPAMILNLLTSTSLNVFCVALIIMRLMK